MPEKKEDKRKLYFLAIIPPAPFFDEALQLKQYIRDHYGSSGALKSPPHITLHMPFKWKEEKEEQLINKLVTFTSTCASFSCEFKNFGSFPPRVIFIDVVKSDLLKNLQRNLMRYCKQELNLFNANYKELPFHPHLTVAFRDLKKSAYKNAWEEFMDKKFEGQFVVQGIVLLKHNGKVWEEFKKLSFTERD